MDITKKKEELLKCLLQPTLFYLPDSLLPNISKKSREKLVEIHFFNTIVLLKADGSTKEFEGGTDSFEIFKKEGVLNSNILQLMEIKGKSNKEAFRFLMENYIGTVKGYNYIYKWLYDNAEKDIPNISDISKKQFEYQKNVMENHLRDMNARFHEYINVPAQDTKKLILKNNKAFSLNKKEVRDLVKENRSESNQKQKVKQQQKQLLLTKEAADEYLLKTVFNVKLGKE